jgi:hypothetical protein
MHKHNWYRFLISGLILLLLPISVIACESQPQGNEAESPGDVVPTKPIAKAYADFEVGPLTIMRDGVSVGEVATVSTIVVNTGDVEGIYKAVLTVDGNEVDGKDVPVDAKGAEVITFQVAEDATGSYELAIGESTAMLNVYEWPYKIQYDVGNLEGILSIAGDLGHIVRFTPPATPFRVQKIELYVKTRVADKSDWGDRYFTVRIWNSDKSKQLWSENMKWYAFYSEAASFWKEIEVPNVTANGDFWVEIVTHSDKLDEDITAWYLAPEVSSPAIFVGYDTPNPYITDIATRAETRSGVSYQGNLVEVPVKYQGIDWLIRAEGDGRL